MSDTVVTAALGKHGAERLPAVDVDSYNLELKDDEGFLGDRASRKAFHDILENWRKPLRKLGSDPFGETPSDDLSRSKLDQMLKEGKDLEAIAVVQSAIEEYAQELALVVRRFLKAKAWEGTERIAMGGGFRESHIGEQAIARADLILKADGIKVDLVPIHNDPDEAALIGSLHLAPAWIFKGHDSILAIDIGGTNIRAGVVLPNVARASDLTKASVWKSEKWRHADEEKLNREKAVDELVGMLRNLIKRAKKESYNLAPFIGIGCPGKIEEDGSIAKGAQNLPGNWESSRFNLPERLAQAIPSIDNQDITILMHNDAVVQGLSEVPFMQDVKRWGALTIGTGLGNARFTNRRNGKEAAKDSSKV
ncbi:MAG: ROK family protein [Alphaproteobacteria bacterium]|nr:MAG: ROK family protein [Alphaproteobacteria bacterium]